MRARLPSVVLVIALLGGCGRADWRAQLQSENPLARIEGAIAAGKAREAAAVPLLVDRLEDNDVAVRMYAILALSRIEGTSLGYRYWADPVERSRAAQRWRLYLQDKELARRQAAESDEASLAQQSAHSRTPDGAAPPATQPARSATADPGRDAPSTQPLAQELRR